MSKARRLSEVKDSLTPPASYLTPADENFFLTHNYDPYLKPVLKEPDPKEVVKGPSLWRRLLHTFF